MIHVAYHLLHEYGYGVITLAVLLECSGVLVPGETVFFGSAVSAATSGQLNIYAVIAAASVGAIFGNFIGYAIGRLLGEKILARHGWRVGLTERRLALGRYLFRLHGGKMVFFCRFLSLLRTFGRWPAVSRGRWQTEHSPMPWATPPATCRSGWRWRSAWLSLRRWSGRSASSGVTRCGWRMRRCGRNGSGWGESTVVR